MSADNWEKQHVNISRVDSENYLTSDAFGIEILVFSGKEHSDNGKLAECLAGCWLVGGLAGGLVGWLGWLVGETFGFDP